MENIKNKNKKMVRLKGVGDMSNIEAVKDNLKKATEEDIKRISKELGKYTTTQLKREIEKRNNTDLPILYLVEAVKDLDYVSEGEFCKGSKMLVQHFRAFNYYGIIHSDEIIIMSDVKVIAKYTGEEV